MSGGRLAGKAGGALAGSAGGALVGKAGGSTGGTSSVQSGSSNSSTSSRSSMSSKCSVRKRGLGGFLKNCRVLVGEELGVRIMPWRQYFSSEN